jgi:hypothetical protein
MIIFLILIKRGADLFKPAPLENESMFFQLWINISTCTNGVGHSA